MLEKSRVAFRMNTSLKSGVVKQEVAIVSVGEPAENPMPSGDGWRERRMIRVLSRLLAFTNFLVSHQSPLTSSPYHPLTCLLLSTNTMAD